MSNSNDKHFELEKHLHEQYAINNNSNLGSIITLITTLLGVIGVFGYMFIHTTLEFAVDWGGFYIKDKTYTLDVLLFAAFASYFILVIIFYLSAYLGTNQRKEQFITYSIRISHYTKEKAIEDYENIFPKDYHPYNKNKSDFIQGLYGKICCIIKILFLIITILTFLKIACNICKHHDYGCASYCTIILIHLFIASVILSLISFYCTIERMYDSYKGREDEFRNKRWGLKHEKEKEQKRNCCIRKFLCCK